MSGDPAIAAAQRAWESLPDIPTDGPFNLAVAAAWEALDPLRDVVSEWERYRAYGVDLPLRDVIARLKPLLYSSSELEGDSDAQ